MRRSILNAAVALAGVVALVGPAAAEWSALAQLRQGVARCPGSTSTATCGGLARADIDVDGLRLWHPFREHAGIRAEARRVAITVSTTGLHIDVDNLILGRATATPTRPAGPSAAQPSAAPAPRPARASVLHTHGVPVHVRVHGETQWSVAGVTASVSDAELHLDGHGEATTRFVPTVHGRGLQVHGQGPWVAQAIDGDPRRWHASGQVALFEGPTVATEFTVDPERVTVQLHDERQGQVELSIPTAFRPGQGPVSLVLVAEHFALAALGRLGARSLHAAGVDPTDAVLDGGMTLDGTRSQGELQLDALSIDGLVVDNPKLARDAVHWDAVSVDGNVSWAPDHLQTSLWIGHRQAAVSLTASVDPEAVDVQAALAPLPCAQLVGAFPDAMAEMVAGTQLAGEIEGRAELHVDRAALALAKATPGRASDATGPGTLDVEFPFLERCTVLADDPRLDLPALSGPYRHHFVDDRGHAQTRVMAPGAPGYIALHQVSRLARAFITLEDRRFWVHDGFDREQMGNAFWHNLVKGRVSRGASTISQQAARNLWLGVDRSWARKLQEALLTARLEVSTDKARIMELYLNVIELGPGTHGVDEAARLYFGTSASRLTPLQAVHLAALAPAPRRFAKTFIDGHVDAEWMDMLRANVRRMHRAGFISRAQMLTAQHDELGLLDRR